MKRDMDLARAILLEIEKQPSHDKTIDIKLSGYSEDEIAYHLALLSEAGLIEVERISKSWSEKILLPKRLTWQGHEFLEAARDQGRWIKAKEIVKDKGGSLTFGVLKSVLTKLLLQQVGL